MFEQLGLTGDRLDTVTDSYLDWTDDDDDVRPNGAEFGYYASRHIHAPNGAPQSFEELALIRGFDPALVERLRAVATLHFGAGGFNAAHASPIAIAVMKKGGGGSPEAIDAEREARGQRTAIDLDDSGVAGRTVEIAVDASTAGGGRSRLSQLIELTGNKDRPFAVLESN